MKKYGIQIILIAVFLLLFAVTAALVLSGALAGAEASVADAFSKAGPDIAGVMKIITHVGSFPFLCGLSVLLVLIPYTRKKFGYLVALAAIASALLNLILKNIFRRERPGSPLTGAVGFSFPSGHSQSSTAIFITAALLLFANIRRLRITVPIFISCILIPVVIGISRLCLGVHYAGDVAAGWFLGAAIALVANTVWPVLDEKLKKHTKIHAFLFIEEKICSK